MGLKSVADDFSRVTMSIDDALDIISRQLGPLLAVQQPSGDVATKISDFNERRIIQSALIRDIERRFRVQGVELPFPQRYPYVRNVDGEAIEGLKNGKKDAGESPIFSRKPLTESEWAMAQIELPKGNNEHRLQRFVDKFNALSSVFDSMPTGVVAIFDRHLNIATIKKWTTPPQAAGYHQESDLFYRRKRRGIRHDASQ